METAVPVLERETAVLAFESIQQISKIINIQNLATIVFTKYRTGTKLQTNCAKLVDGLRLPFF